MEFIHLIREKQAELIRLYHLEETQKGMGVMVFRKDKTDNAQVIYYPLENITSTYIVQRLRAMVLAMEGKLELKLEHRLIITLPQFEDLPEGLEIPKVMYFCIMDGADGRLFQLIPQTTKVEDKTWYYYQMIADPTIEEMNKEHVSNKDTWTVGPTENGKWFKQTCLLALSNDILFKTFRSAREFREIIGNENEAYGKQIVTDCDLSILGDIRNYKYLDEIGGPIRYYYSEIDCELSPTTLRYMNTVLDVTKHFTELDDKRIIEIGGGYGGLCSVLSQIIEYKKYTFVEIEPVIGLAKRYLNEINKENEEIDLVVPEQIPEDVEWDLLISEYAFCELNEEGIEFYLKHIFPRVKNCYLGMNVWEEVRKTQILKRLEELFTTVTEHKVTPEHPEWKRYILVCKR